MKKRPRYGPEIKARARELRGAGHNYRAIARLLGINAETIRYWLNPEAAAKKTQYYEENRERINQRTAQYNAQWRRENKEHIAQYYQKNKEHINQRNAQYYQENRDKITQQGAQYRQENPEKIRARNAKRRADKKKATPPWFNSDHKRQCDALHAEAIRLEQENGTPYHVDHIYPITGKTRINGKYIHTSCGLHVPWNLKVLPGAENLSKSCKLPDPAVDPPTAW